MVWEHHLQTQWRLLILEAQVLECGLGPERAGEDKEGAGGANGDDGGPNFNPPCTSSLSEQKPLPTCLPQAPEESTEPASWVPQVPKAAPCCTVQGKYISEALCANARQSGEGPSQASGSGWPEADGASIQALGPLNSAAAAVNLSLLKSIFSDQKLHETQDVASVSTNSSASCWAPMGTGVCMSAVRRIHGQEPPEEDPWDLPELWDTAIKWSERDTKGKIRCIFKGIGKLIWLLGFLYFFVCPLDVLGRAFQLVGGKMARQLFSNNSIFSTLVAGLMTGLLVTVMVQSSSTSLSIVMSMVASSLLTVKAAYPSSRGQHWDLHHQHHCGAHPGRDQNKFRRAFVGAAVHNFFNWLSVLVLLPLEAITHYLERLTGLMVNTFNFQNGEDALALLKVITDPFTKLTVQLDKNKNVAVPLNENWNSSSFCWTDGAFTWTLKNVTQQEDIAKCKYIFVNAQLLELVVGIILLIISLLVLWGCLIMIIRLLGSVPKGQVVTIIKKTINTDFPFPFSWVTSYLAILVGASMTFIMQSSSVFTSALTLLIGISVITIKRVYPLMLGSNIGTTTTTIMAFLASSGHTLMSSLQITLCHFFFNISGILLWYPIPFTCLPIRLAKGLGNISSKYRWFAIIHLIILFLLTLLVVFGLSLASWLVLLGVVLLLCSLEPWDCIISLLTSCCQQHWCCSCHMCCRVCYLMCGCTKCCHCSRCCEDLGEKEEPGVPIKRLETFSIAKTQEVRVRPSTAS
ncbi:Sodium-dependent phosphate transport protein 2B [Heterocephalus glaber]|uniref:Sodium-dependent phosphate transport protein 2B n=1 Tax=Heterocephalus glaber TaxID=10181 RepID=G5AL58_HETGA|nr:Sodium-dependent phosphate transport protein 2B [Heterocephalus glaber]